MDDKIRLGFVGAGFVGGATIRAFSGYFPISVYDKGKGIGDLRSVCQNSDVIFVSVPTPMRKDGSCDTRIVIEVAEEINRYIKTLGRGDDGIEVVIRSTVPPDFMGELWQILSHVNLLFVPEFLTARTADLDFINSSRFIIGSLEPENSEHWMKTVAVLRERFPRTRITTMSYAEASLVKLGTNNFFAVKLSYFNELYKTAQNNGADPDVVIQEILQDGRIGRSHFQVPGHDGDFGWGGMCFAKDNRSFSIISAPNNKMVDAAWEVNNEVRTNRDWERDIGRAVSED